MSCLRGGEPRRPFVVRGEPFHGLAHRVDRLPSNQRILGLFAPRHPECGELALGLLTSPQPAPRRDRLVIGNPEEPALQRLGSSRVPQLDGLREGRLEHVGSQLRVTNDPQDSRRSSAAWSWKRASTRETSIVARPGSFEVKGSSRGWSLSSAIGPSPLTLNDARTRRIISSRSIFSTAAGAWPNTGRRRELSRSTVRIKRGNDAAKNRDGSNVPAVACSSRLRFERRAPLVVQGLHRLAGQLLEDAFVVFPRTHQVVELGNDLLVVLVSQVCQKRGRDPVALVVVGALGVNGAEFVRLELEEAYRNRSPPRRATTGCAASGGRWTM